MVLLVIGARPRDQQVERLLGARRGRSATLPAGLPQLYWPGLPGWDVLGALLVPALVIALVSSLEMASSAKIESQRDRKRWDASQDLVGQGMGKIGVGLVGQLSHQHLVLALGHHAVRGRAHRLGHRRSPSASCCWCCCSSRRLSTTCRAPCSRPWSSPRWRACSGRSTLLRLWRIDRVEAAHRPGDLRRHRSHRAAHLLGRADRRADGPGAISCTCGCTRASSRSACTPTAACATAICGSCRRWRRSVYALRMDDELDFASASAFERAVVEHLAAHPRRAARVPVRAPDQPGRCDRVSRCSATCARLLAERGIQLHISGIKLPVERVLRKAGVLDDGPLLQHVPHRCRSAAGLRPAQRRPSAPQRTSRADDPAFQRIEVLGQAVARRAMPMGPGRLHQAEHGVEAVAAGIVHQRVTLRVGELQAQAQPGAAVLQRAEQVLARDQAVGRLLGRSSLL